MSGRKSGDNDISVILFEDDPSLHFACLMQTAPRWTDNGDSLLNGSFYTEFVYFLRPFPVGLWNKATLERFHPRGPP